MTSYKSGGLVMVSTLLRGVSISPYQKPESKWQTRRAQRYRFSSTRLTGLTVSRMVPRTPRHTPRHTSNTPPCAIRPGGISAHWPGSFLRLPGSRWTEHLSMVSVRKACCRLALKPRGSCCEGSCCEGACCEGSCCEGSCCEGSCCEG